MSINSKIQELNLDISGIIGHFEGGNSSVLKVKLANNSVLALKFYKGSAKRVEQMQTRELNAINFLKGQDFRNIPEIVENRRDLGLIVFKWIEGSSPPADTKSMDSIIEMCLRLGNLERGGLFFDNAIDAAYSITEIENQIKLRLHELSNQLSSNFSRSLISKYELMFNRYKSTNKKKQALFGHTFSVSDLGTHNILCKDNKFIFIDFEFFGKDSITKMVSDFLLHPKNEFSADDISKFVEAISNEFNWDPSTLELIGPILCLKWSLIAFKRSLNEIYLENTYYSEESILKNSIGMKYLEFFDFLISSIEVQRFPTFQQFTGIV